MKAAKPKLTVKPGEMFPFAKLVGTALLKSSLARYWGGVYPVLVHGPLDGATSSVVLDLPFHGRCAFSLAEVEFRARGPKPAKDKDRPKLKKVKSAKRK